MPILNGYKMKKSNLIYIYIKRAFSDWVADVFYDEFLLELS